MHVKIKLFQSYCSSMYGLQNTMFLKTCCCYLRSALWCLLNLPYKTHCFLSSLLTGTLPVFDKICKRSARLINSCLQSRNYIVSRIAQHSVIDNFSPLGKNLRFCCHQFEWHWENVVSGYISLQNDCFRNFCVSNTEVDQFQNSVIGRIAVEFTRQFR